LVKPIFKEASRCIGAAHVVAHPAMMQLLTAGDGQVPIQFVGSLTNAENLALGQVKVVDDFIAVE